MSDQGEISDGTVSGFGLIETLLWTPGEGFSLYAEHLGRLARSANALDFAFDRAGAEAALAQAVAGQGALRLRVRLELRPGGEIETSIAAIDAVAADAVWRVAVAKQRFASAEPLLRHKTTRRELYESELARSGADEVLFLNERDEVCEGARTNVFLAQGATLLTPPLESGLLPGTLRERLLREGRAREEFLALEDFENAEFYMGNSVRGLVRAVLVG
jgi:4-amino-4-deoxychorismate lyase